MSGFDDAILVMIGWTIDKLSAVSILDFISPFLLIFGVLFIAIGVAESNVGNKEIAAWLGFLGALLLGAFACFI